ncbi:putative oxygenase MesX, partial [Xanthomonas vasicola]
MTQDLNFTIKSLRFDEDYRPSATTRNTTNFANLARGQL